METEFPSRQDIEKLISFAPRIDALDRSAIVRWRGGESGEDGSLSAPYPEYHEVVSQFYEAASGECWCGYDYDSGEAGRMLEDWIAVRSATLAHIKTMLTFCVRGERFCDGHWAAMIEAGHIGRLLDRLEALAGED